MEKVRKHGLCKTPEYKIWQRMNYRCRNQNADCFANYGGRGITVCQQWQDSFEAFLADVGQRPDPKLTLDRIDNDRGYEPDNVRWATRKVQAINCRMTKADRVRWGRINAMKRWHQEHQ